MPVELFCNHFGMALLSAMLTISFARNDSHELRRLGLARLSPLFGNAGAFTRGGLKKAREQEDVVFEGTKQRLPHPLVKR